MAERQVVITLTETEQQAFRGEFSEPYGRDIRLGVIGKLRDALEEPEARPGVFEEALEAIARDQHRGRQPHWTDTPNDEWRLFLNSASPQEIARRALAARAPTTSPVGEEGT
jgi:hypothetical protein